jgi:hypothetical protein
MACWQCHGTGGPEVAWVVFGLLITARRAADLVGSLIAGPIHLHFARTVIMSAGEAATGRGNRACGPGLRFGAARWNSGGRHRVRFADVREVRNRAGGGANC